VGKGSANRQLIWPSGDRDIEPLKNKERNYNASQADHRGSRERREESPQIEEDQSGLPPIPGEIPERPRSLKIERNTYERTLGFDLFDFFLRALCHRSICMATDRRAVARQNRFGGPDVLGAVVAGEVIGRSGHMRNSPEENQLARALKGLFGLPGEWSVTSCVFANLDRTPNIGKHLQITVLIERRSKEKKP